MKTILLAIFLLSNLVVLGQNWTQHTRIDSIGNYFGKRVHISADGKTLFACTGNLATDEGTTSIYEKVNNNWIFSTRMDLKFILDVTPDGSTIFCHVRKDSFNVMKKFGANWVLDGSFKITTNRTANSLLCFGAISSDGNTIVIGDYGYDNFKGQVFVYVKGTSGWVQQSRLLTSVPTDKSFGQSVDISDDGNTIVVNAVGMGAGETKSISIYEKTGTTWNLKFNYPLTDLRYHVSISRNGLTVNTDGIGFKVINKINGNWVVETNNNADTLISGSYNTGRLSDGFGKSYTGDTILGIFKTNPQRYVYAMIVRSNGVWSISDTFTVQQNPQIPVGYSSYAFSADGQTLAIGNNTMPINTKVGMVWILSKNVSTGNWEKQSIELSSYIYPNPSKDKISIRPAINIDKVQIYNSVGSLVETLENNGNELNISHLPNGLYFLQVHGEMIKVVKE